jgi:hypothetical protein
MAGRVNGASASRSSSDHKPLQGKTMNNWSTAGIGLIVGAAIGWLVAGAMGDNAGGTPPPAGTPKQVVESFFLEFPGDVVALTHGGQMFLPTFPGDISRLDEPALNTSMGTLAKVRDTQGNIVGFATELEVFPKDMAQTFMTGKAVWGTVWTVVIPGRGAVFLVEQEQSGKFAADIMGPVLANRKSWTGSYDQTTTVGPGGDGRGLIAGGSGDFEGARGAFIERNHFTRFDPDGALRLKTELRLFFTVRPRNSKKENKS